MWWYCCMNSATWTVSELSNLFSTKCWDDIRLRFSAGMITPWRTNPPRQEMTPALPLFRFDHSWVTSSEFTSRSFQDRHTGVAAEDRPTELQAAVAPDEGGEGGRGNSPC